MDTLLLWGFGLIALAGLLFCIEVFVPSGGVLGIASFAVAVAGVIAFWRYSSMWGASSTLFVLVMIPVCFNFALRIMPHTPVGKLLILAGDTPDDDEYFPKDGAPDAEARAAALIDAEGVVLSELRPVGEVRINGERYEGHAEEGIIAAGSRVRVIDTEGDRLTVRRV